MAKSSKMNEQKRKQLEGYQNEIKQSQDELVIAYMPALRALASRLKSRLPSSVDLSDLISAGVSAMVVLARAYDKEKNDNFWGYARPRVYGSMLDFLRSLDTLSRGDRKLVKLINDEISSFFNKNEEEPSDLWLSQKLGVSEQEIREAKNLSEISMLLPLDEQFGVLSNEESTIEKVEKEDLIEKIMEILKEFSLKEQQIIQLYYFEELNLGEISEVLGISVSRISQIHKKLMLKLRERLGF